ncbi:acyltransferase [Gramella sp. GC03-9]|uniref:Acyltransferase n=1 Tax=Christiangramia oceanisediminis TaxID=2920386 RepID=A0A9X2KWK5_9FLAO|nr:acyltransferase [Gramella oceanisediminis]MCP9199514.1 acyltransferase [Gramella oceanisediminis]
MKYIKQLDSVRAIAVLLVIISHWLPKSFPLNQFPIGVTGVNIFFVLSGFLITSILFQNKNKSEVSNSTIIRSFYARRVLRIFPIYYLTIFTLLLLHEYTKTNIEEDFIYYLTYTTNFNFILNEKWDGMLSHLWSLAVEEQFYLIWPWLIIFIRRKYLIHMISAFILIGLGSRFIFMDYDWNRILTTSCFDSLGLGAMLSWFTVYKVSLLPRFYKWIKVLSILVLFNYILYFLFYEEGYWIPIPQGTIDSIIATLGISFIYLNRDSGSPVFRFLLNQPALIFFGKISYGIYLYHKILPSFTWMIRFKLQGILPSLKPVFENQNMVLLTDFIILILLSWLSYRLIEMPFLRLKKHFKINQANSKTLYETS